MDATANSGRVVRDADADPSSIGRDVVDAIGRDLAELLVLEVVHFHAPRITLRPPIAAGVAVVADQFLLLGVDGDDGLTSGLGRHNFGVDILELGVPVGMA